MKIVNITGLYISLTKFGRQKNDVQNPERVTVAGAEFTLYEVVNGKATVVQTQTTDVLSDFPTKAAEATPQTETPASA